VVGGAKWLPTLWTGTWDHAFNAVSGRIRSLQYSPQLPRPDIRKIASYNQIPIGRSAGKGRVNSTQRTLGRTLIRINRKAKVRVQLRMANQANITRSYADLARDVIGQAPRQIRKQSLVCSHAAASTAGKHEPSVPHRGIIASEIHPPEFSRPYKCKLILCCFSINSWKPETVSAIIG
jgi:hypothetical protein